MKVKLCRHGSATKLAKCRFAQLRPCHLTVLEAHARRTSLDNQISPLYRISSKVSMRSSLYYAKLLLEVVFLASLATCQTFRVQMQDVWQMYLTPPPPSPTDSDKTRQSAGQSSGTNVSRLKFYRIYSSSGIGIIHPRIV